MKRRHRKTLALIFRHPVSGNIPWRKIEALLIELGAEITQREGSRIGVRLSETGGCFTARIRRRTSMQARSPAFGNGYGGMEWNHEEHHGDRRLQGHHSV